MESDRADWYKSANSPVARVDLPDPGCCFRLKEVVLRYLLEIRRDLMNDKGTYLGCAAHGSSRHLCQPSCVNVDGSALSAFKTLPVSQVIGQPDGAESPGGLGLSCYFRASDVQGRMFIVLKDCCKKRVRRAFPLLGELLCFLGIAFDANSAFVSFKLEQCLLIKINFGPFAILCEDQALVLLNRDATKRLFHYRKIMVKFPLGQWDLIVAGASSFGGSRLPTMFGCIEPIFTNWNV